MRKFPHPSEHFKRHMERSAEKYITGLKRAGLQPNRTLTDAMIERAVEGAERSYTEEATAVLQHNIKVITRYRNRRIKQIMGDFNKAKRVGDRRIENIKRKTRRQGSWKTCLLIALPFGFVAWYDLTHGGFILGICFAVCSFVCLAIQILGGF